MRKSPKKISVKRRTTNLADMLPISGVYKITNSLNGKVYVGQSKDILNRWRVHIAELLKGIHHNAALRTDFQVYGLSVFVAEVLEEAPEHKLLETEARYIEEYSKLGGVYNTSIAALPPESLYNERYDTPR